MPELAGAVGFSRVSDGRSDPRQPALCLLDHSLLVLSSSGTWAHPAGDVCPASSSPVHAALHLLTQAPSRGPVVRFPCSPFWEAWALTCPCSKVLGFTKCLVGPAELHHLLPPHILGVCPIPVPSALGPALERSPWEWLLGGNREEERKWESRAPSTRGSIPAPPRGWFQSTDTNRQIQTHTDRFRHTQKPTRPTGASLPLRRPPPTPRFPCLPVEAIPGLPSPSP